MAFFDLPAPLFSLLDGALVAFPALFRIILWGLISGVLSMFLYAKLSPQGRLSEIKQELQVARGQLAASDESFDELMGLVQRTLRLSFQHLGLVLLPAIVASLPLISVLAWASNQFGYQFPAPGSLVQLTVYPQEAARDLQLLRDNGAVDSIVDLQLRWPDNQARTVLQDSTGKRLLELPPSRPIPQIHKKLWWNVLIGNPAGYLPQETNIEVLQLQLPEQRHLEFGPPWLGHWLTLFFSALVVSALLTKFIFKIN